MHELIYTSIANWEMTTKELTELLEQSREKNASLDITGLLVYHNRGFMQLLEGDKKAIFDLYDTITKDERHTSVQLFWNGPIEARSFKDWAMAFINTNGVDLGKIVGYSHYLEDGMAALRLTGNTSTGREFIDVLRDQYLEQE